MNFCMHGYPIENCPHCLKSNGIKPPIQLVKPFPREISLPRNPEENLLNTEKSTQPSLFEASNFINRKIKPINRKFELNLDQIQEKNALFENRKNILKEKYNHNSESEDIFKSEQIINLKKKFVQN